MDLQQLNQEQQNAATTTEGYVRVIASCGTGKTRVLANRFAYLVLDLGILPENILCVTFTNKAAAEMRQRIHLLTGDNDTGMITTFHGFGNMVLQEESFAINYPKNFIVLDNRDIDIMLEAVYEQRGLSLRHMSFSKAREMIEIQKLFNHPDYYKDLCALSVQALYDKFMRAVSTEEIIFYGYLWQQKKCYGLDYNDLLILTLYIFETRPDIEEKWQRRLEYIMIDEFQDIDGLQYKLMEKLQKFHRNLFVVGDPDQTIYTWRGARAEYLLEFDRNFSPCRTCVLKNNYRSTESIVNVCNSLISCNANRYPKEMVSMQQAGRKVQAFEGKTAAEEAAWMVSKMQELHAEGRTYGDMTVLYRAHYISRTIEDALLEAKIPYVICSGAAFFDRMEIRDALGYLRFLAFQDDLSFLRVINTPKRNIGKRRLEAIQAAADRENISFYQAMKKMIDDPLFSSTKAAEFIELMDNFEWKEKPISQVLSEILDLSGYEKMLRLQGSQERLDNLAEFKQSVAEFETDCQEETDLASYLNQIALYTGTERMSRKDAVKLMSIHTAKGLEFETVFLMGLSEGMFPAKKVKSAAAMEEERRLAFVAMSRAVKDLFLSWSRGKNHDGSSRFVSRFVLNIHPAFLDLDHEIDELELQDARNYIRVSETMLTYLEKAAEFQPGDRIEHPAFGAGLILSVDPDRKCYTIDFDALPAERKITFRARMKKIGHTDLAEVMN